MDKDKRFVSYPVEDAEFRPVISIGGREYAVMPYMSYAVIPQELIDAARQHPEHGGEEYYVNAYSQSLLNDIVEHLKDAMAVSAVDRGVEDGRHEYHMLLPVLMPLDTRDRWGGEWTPERGERFENAAFERKKSGKPYIFKMVEDKEE